MLNDKFSDAAAPIHARSLAASFAATASGPVVRSGPSLDQTNTLDM